MEFYEKPVSRKKVYEGLIVNVRDDSAELWNGKLVRREVVEHLGGVAIVPIDRDGNVIMVRQFRYPMGEELLEIPAGKLEYGEDHYDCAVRELSEETGCAAGKMIYLGPLYTSPGFSEEILHIYLGLDLTEGEMHLDEDEFLRVERVPVSEVIEHIMENRIPDSKTIVGLFKAKAYLENKGDGVIEQDDFNR